MTVNDRQEGPVCQVKHLETDRSQSRRSQLVYLTLFIRPVKISLGFFYRKIPNPVLRSLNISHIVLQCMVHGLHSTGGLITSVCLVASRVSCLMSHNLCNSLVVHLMLLSSIRSSLAQSQIHSGHISTDRPQHGNSLTPHLYVALSFLHLGSQQVSVSVHRHSTEPATTCRGPSDLREDLVARGGEDDDATGVRHDDLPGRSDAH